MPMTLLGTFIKPMHREGWRFLLPAIGVTAVMLWLYQPVGWVCLLITIWIYYFFRDPKRTIPIEPSVILSPADGVVSLIEKAVPPEELDIGTELLTRVSVFMSVFNCHVNRAPIAGDIVQMVYRPGKFVSASLDKASSDNERNSLIIKIADGRHLIVVQIAGLVARRIVPFIKIGDHVQAGERFGLIRFGSRLDVYLPPGVAPLCGIGQTMIAGESVIADLGNSQPITVRRE
ncbi:MAG: phosphatidylserine decarboxylase [Deltaproteobacteria bacterium]